jgi:hypothetical protein
MKRKYLLLLWIGISVVASLFFTLAPLWLQGLALAIGIVISAGMLLLETK